ncbi:MAG: nitronate monooxygenase [Bacteroidetes bacterium]|nr:nitronate monooxygenase [Bacteroidota bacterium]
MKNISSLLRIQYPVIQGPMLGVTSPEMVAAVSNSGGLGSLPIGGLSPDVAGQLIRKTKSLTSSPGAVNLFAHAIPERIDEAGLQRMQDYLESYARQRSLPFSRRTAGEFRFYSYREQIDTLLEEDVRIVSFTFGVPAPDVISRLKDRGVILIGTATSVAEAVALADAGVDAVVAQGYEAGGHRGSFLEPDLPQVGLFALLPQIADAVAVPVIAAGGIVDGRTIRAAFQLGASGVQPGTLFVPSTESLASEGYKDAVIAARDTDTQLTQAFTGRWARGIRNDFMRTTEASGVGTAEYNVHNSLTAGLRAHGRTNDVPDVVSLWAGQHAGKARKGGAAEIFRNLVAGIDFDAL